MRRFLQIIFIVSDIFAICTVLWLSMQEEKYTYPIRTFTETRDELNHTDDVQDKTENFPSNSKNTEAYTSFENEQIQATNKAQTNVLNPHLKTPAGAGILNIYNISNIKQIDTSLCVKSSTQTVFTICTWELKNDIYVSRAVHKTGKWEPVITQMIQNVLNQGRNVTFVDIGANIGYFSLLAASAGQHVISVEPWEQHIQKIVNSIHINKFEDRMTIVNNAVSNSRRKLQFYVPWANNQGSARIVLDKKASETTERFSANSITLNNLADIILTTDVVIKMDIEGHECLAMKSADQIFDGFNVLFISMEWVVMRLFRNRHGAACPRANIQKMLDILTSRGFIPYSFPDNKQLDIKQSDMWTFRDIFWIQK